MNIFDLDPYKLPFRRLYRVQYDESMTSYSVHAGLEAKDTQTYYDEYDDIYTDFGGTVERHLSWDNRFPSIFISLFSDKRHAENWMLEGHARFGCKNCQLLEIDVANLGLIFNAQDIVNRLSLHVPQWAEASICNEFLVAYRIPSSAIMSSRTIEEIQMAREPVPFLPEDFASQELVGKLQALGL